MSVLINGMEMPISCEKCPMLDWDLDYIKCKITGRHFKMTECWRSIRVSDCPLVQVPPHGRLIDADALEDKCYLDIRNIGYNNPHEQKYQVLRNIANAPTIIESIANAPTIIESEGE